MSIIMFVYFSHTAYFIIYVPINIRVYFLRGLSLIDVSTTFMWRCL
jgi:hypothetical protein